MEWFITNEKAGSFYQTLATMSRSEDVLSKTG
jgi:hypothetical protein